MRRPLFTGISLLSLLLCLATLLLWYRSFGLAESATWHTSTQRLLLQSTNGSLHLDHTRTRIPFFRGRPQRFRLSSDIDGPNKYRLFGLFHFSTATLPTATSTNWRLILPHWFCALLLSLPPILWLYTHRQRLAPHLCPICRYDLRATPNRCPECGHIPPPAHQP